MNAQEIKAARKAANLTCREASELIGVSLPTWQRWEGQNSKAVQMPKAALELFLLKIDAHESCRLVRKKIKNSLINIS